MKKIFLSMALVAAMCMTSCGGSNDASKAGDAEAEAVEASADSLANAAAESKAAFEQQLNEAAGQVEALKDEAEAKYFLAKAQDYVQQLINDGKAQEAKEYLAKIGPAITAKYPALKDVVEGADKLVDAAIATGTGAVRDAADNAVEGAKDAAADAVDAAKQKAGEAVDAAKDKAAEAAGKATDAAAKAVDATKDAATDAANKAADKAKSLIPGKK